MRDSFTENFMNDLAWLITLRAVKVCDSLRNWGYIASARCASCLVSLDSFYSLAFCYINVSFSPYLRLCFLLSVSQSGTEEPSTTFVYCEINSVWDLEIQKQSYIS